MPQDRWPRVWDLFEAALAVEPEQRDAWLADACAGDEAMRREVESLLDSHGRAGGFIESAVASAAGDVMAGDSAPGREPEPIAGRRVGPYEILRELGRGGMGAVYLAERADAQYRQHVAIKVVRGGLDSPDLLQRFRGERQILADLDHPNIARLLDGGATPGGSPYVVMEYVDGERIDRYCDRRLLTVEERLGLFRSVCSAAQYAHRNLVVHRDIKPANILVTTEGVPKLLDFGIAKLLDPGSASHGAPATRTAMQLLTPEYASPEQVRGGAITTASDVYSLGVLLYELLTGALPCRFQAWGPEAARSICDNAPDRPSAAVSRRRLAGAVASSGAGEPAAAGRATHPSSDDVSRARGTTPDRLRRRLRGDLDNIVLMALRKEPERRYASAEHLSEDIRRHLAGLPVLARKDTWGYRAGKFVRRNRLAVAAAGALLVLLAASVAGLFVTSVRTARERDRALAAEARALTEAATARQVSDFLVELFEVVDPDTARGREMKAMEVLDQGARRITTTLQDQPAIQARLMETMGRVYQSLGDYDTSLPLAEEGLRKRESLYGENHPEVAQSLNSIGSTRHIRGDLEGADRSYLRALEIETRLGDQARQEKAVTMTALGSLRLTQGRLEEAGTMLGDALDAARLEHGARHPTVWRAMNLLARLRDQKGDYTGAERLLREALEAQTTDQGEDHPDLVTTLNNLGGVLEHAGRYAEAEEVLRRNLDLNRRLYGDEHMGVGVALSNLSGLLKQQGKAAAAEALQREALALFRGLFGGEHRLVASGLNDLANLRHDQGDYEGAERIHRESLALHRRLFGDPHPEVATSLANLANLLWDKGDYARSEPLYREALALDRRLLGDEHPYVAMDLNNLALVLRDLGRLEDAEPLVRQALRISAQALGAENHHTALYRESLGLLLVKMGRAQEGEPLLREAIRVLTAVLPAEHWQIDRCHGFLGQCLAAMGRQKEAEPLMLRAYEALARKNGDKYRDTIRAREALAALYQQMGEPAKAASYRSSR